MKQELRIKYKVYNSVEGFSLHSNFSRPSVLMHSVLSGQVRWNDCFSLEWAIVNLFSVLRDSGFDFRFGITLSKY